MKSLLQTAGIPVMAIAAGLVIGQPASASDKSDTCQQGQPIAECAKSAEFVVRIGDRTKTFSGPYKAARRKAEAFVQSSGLSPAAVKQAQSKLAALEKRLALKSSGSTNSAQELDDIKGTTVMFKLTIKF